MSAASAIVAVDVGNTRTKFGLFTGGEAQGLPSPKRVLRISSHAHELEQLATFLDARPASDFAWHIGSVNRAAAGRVIDWLREAGAASRVTMLIHGDLPIEVRLDRPDMVGIDRLLAAVAANHLRAADRPAVVVGMGTAVTVDLVSIEGAFLGGAILPGVEISARAMHAFTDMLPLVDVRGFDTTPPALGRSTIEAMQAGLYWGALGGVRELIARYGEQVGKEPQVFLSGGAASTVARPLASTATVVDDLTLAGIALAARR
ncbi:MAG: type III pantothenate kinase [Pirellulales bacterium]|nr:type III pantothenate kinase [Pirellulales bacterium]